MPQGLQIWDESGNLVVDVSDRLMRSLSTINTGNSDGSVSVTGGTQGTAVGVALTEPMSGTTPTVTSSGNTISWTFNGAAAGERRAVDLRVMVF